MAGTVSYRLRPTLTMVSVLVVVAWMAMGPASTARPAAPVTDRSGDLLDFWVACEHKGYPWEGFPTRYCSVRMRKALYFRNNFTGANWRFCVRTYPHAKPGARRPAGARMSKASRQYCSPRFGSDPGQLYRAWIKAPRAGLVKVRIYINGRVAGAWRFWNNLHFHIRDDIFLRQTASASGVDLYPHFGHGHFDWWTACEFRDNPFEGFPTRYCQEKMRKGVFFRSNHVNTGWWYCVWYYPHARPKPGTGGGGHGGHTGHRMAVELARRGATSSRAKITYCSDDYFAAAGTLYRDWVRAPNPGRYGVSMWLNPDGDQEYDDDTHLGEWKFWNALHFHLPG